MIHWWYEQFETKWGFDDGDHTPAGAEKVRDFMVRAINYGLKVRGITDVEAYGYDRTGLHNCWLILYRKPGEEDKEESEPSCVHEILDALEDYVEIRDEVKLIVGAWRSVLKKRLKKNKEGGDEAGGAVGCG